MAAARLLVGGGARHRGGDHRVLASNMARPRLLIALLVLWATGPHISAQRSATMTISVVATTDLHGAVLPRGERGGVALLGGYVRNIRAARVRDGGGTILVDSGDMFQGTLESNLNEGAAVVRAYNALGYAAAAIGNHEFDFGPAGPDETPRTPGEDPRGALKARAAQARFPFLAANTIDTATGQPVTWPNVKPSTIVTVRGVRIGLIGVTTIDTAAQTIAANLGGLTFAPLAPAITREATSLRSRGATIVIVLAHAGGRCAKLDDPADLSSCDRMAEIVNVALQLPGGLVDMISAGHTHQAMAQDVAGIAVVEAYSTGRSFSRVDLTVNRSSGAVVSRKIFPPQDATPGRYEKLAVTPDATASAAIAPAVRKAMTIKTQPLGVGVETPLARGSQQDETAIADLITDGMLASVPGADVAIGNGGSLRADLPAGPLTYGAVYEVYPFDNRLVTFSLTGDQLTRIVAYNLQRTALPTELLPIAGFRVDAKCEGNMLRVALTRASGMPIRPDDRLTATTSDFVAGGGDGVLAPAGPLGEFSNVDGAPLLRESVVTWLRSRGGSLDENQFVSPQNRRWTFPVPRPVICQ
jgi:2',3'-cyclic-nucleotide 2'-phosphodiesterase (5'-nucleotidase family)